MRGIVIAAKMSRRWVIGPLAVLAVVITQGFPTRADALVVFADDFSVMRNSTPIFDDSFTRNATLTSPSATAPIVPNFLDNGAAATYFVQGSIPESSASGGLAQLNTANGVVEAQPDPFIPFISHVSANLNTGTNTVTGVHTLTASTSFLVTGLFNLTVPSLVEGTYGLFLSNRDSVLNGRHGDVVQIRVRECQPGIGACGTATGLVLQFTYLDFVNDTFALIGQMPLDPSHQQILLELSHDSSFNTILGSFAYVDGGVPGSPTPFSGHAFTSGTTNNLFSAADWTRAGFEAFDPVPEPSSLLLLSTSIMALGALAWKRHRRP